MRIFIRPITEHDSFNIVKWRNSEKVRNHCMTKSLITIDSHLSFYKENVLTGKYKQYIVERVEENIGVASYPIATVYLKDIDNENKRCELCVFTSDDIEWNAEGQSLAIKMLVDKAFTEMGMHKLYSYVFDKYPDEILLLKSAGFNLEAKLIKEAINEDGKYENVVRMVIFNGNVK